MADGRKLPVDTVRPYADGRVLSGEQAHQAGLVDKLGGLDVALDTIKELAKLDKKQKVNLVYPEPKRRSLLDMLGRGAADSLMGAFAERLGVDPSVAAPVLKPSAQVGLYFL